jgi:adenosylcobinamide-GDP ribazoletransferase
MVALPYVTGPATKSGHLTGVRAPQAVVAATWLVVVFGAAVALRWTSAARVLFVALSLAAVTAATSWRYVRRVGGFTGDFLGATEQLCELAGYTVLAWKT